jgi:membrane dipeptidase
MNETTNTNETINHAASPKPASASHDNAGKVETDSATITIDMHADTTQRMIDEGVDINTRLASGHLDAARMREGGVDAQFFAVWVHPTYYGAGGKRAMERADKQIAAVRALTERNPETWTLATTAADVRAAKHAGKLAALLALEGGYALDGKIENLKRYYDAGVRYLSPTWSVSLAWAGSSGDAAGTGRGLNEFGRAVVREANDLGMMIDVSHVSDATFRDIIETSTKPVIATHSNARAIANVARNLSDDMIRQIAATGGVVCVVFYPAFIEPGWEAKRTKVDAEIATLVKDARDNAPKDAASQRLAAERVREREYAKRLPAVSISRLVEHIDHIVRLVGIDHVGLGSDFDGIQATPQNLASVADFPNLMAELTRRGYTADDIRKISGGNMLRVMEATQAK